MMKTILSALAALPLLVGCAGLTPEKADAQARLWYSVAGGLDAAALTAEAPELREDMEELAEGARVLAGLIRASALEGDEVVIGYIAEVERVILLVRPSLDKDGQAKLTAVYSLLGALKGYYAPLP